MLESVSSARAGFTRQDMLFIESLHGERSSDAIRRLTQDPECLQELLDQPEIRRALLESPVALPVSPSLYFYTLVRHALVGAGVDHIGLTDHIAGVLVSKLGGPLKANNGPQYWATHAVDFIAQIREAQGLLKVHLEVAAGNQFLVLTGLFPKFIERRERRKGAPGVDYYESVARRAFQSAGEHPLADEFDLREVYRRLAGSFHQTRVALNHLADEYLVLAN